jgi:hypothetical protein
VSWAVGWNCSERSTGGQTLGSKARCLSFTRLERRKSLIERVIPCLMLQRTSQGYDCSWSWLRTAKPDSLLALSCFTAPSTIAMRALLVRRYCRTGRRVAVPTGSVLRQVVDGQGAKSHCAHRETLRRDENSCTDCGREPNWSRSRIGLLGSWHRGARVRWTAISRSWSVSSTRRVQGLPVPAGFADPNDGNL